jgi:DNA-binding LacI/PurR family transcriptional regulator
MDRPASKPIVTSEDVARRAAVSQSAVSRAFTPGASVSAKTREKVMLAAHELGYRPNSLARAVVSGRSRLIAMLVAYLDNQFYPIVLEQLSRELQLRDYQVLLIMTDPGNQDAVVRKILQYQVEGIVMASATLSSNLARECADTGIPVVMFNRYVPSFPASSVTTDNIAGGRLAADYLLRGGHRRIAYVAGAEDSSTNRDREAGFLAGLAAQSVPAFARAVGGYTFAGAAQAARTLLAQPVIPDAIFVANDHMAFAVMDVIRTEFGLRIPQDIAVMAYDDVPEASWASYNLTTVSQSSEQMVAATVELLIEQIETLGVSGRAVLLPAELVVRGSTRPVV